MSEGVAAEIRTAVVLRAKGRCEYCGIPGSAVLFGHEVDHIIAEQHQGKTALTNLALACFHCNRNKGPNIASVDPNSGEIVRLFNPRVDRWSEHFQLQAATLIGLTAIGRASALLHKLNSPQRLQARLRLIESGLWNRG